MKILVLSPHFDDAAFSLSLSMSHWLAVGHSVAVMNVFTRSLYAPYAKVAGESEAELLDSTSELRSHEDRRALGAIGAIDRFELGLTDAPIRLRCDSSIVCDMPVDPKDSAFEKIRAELERAVKPEQGGFTALVLPLGLGHHVDHRTARDAAMPFSTSLPCAFYEDLPYATRDGVRVDLSRFREDAETSLHEPLLPVLCHGTHTRPKEFKRSIALRYKSQIDEALAETISEFPHRYHGAERLWANEAWLAVAAREKLSRRQRDVDAEPLPV